MQLFENSLDVFHFKSQSNMVKEHTKLITVNIKFCIKRCVLRKGKEK